MEAITSATRSKTAPASNAGVGVVMRSLLVDAGRVLQHRVDRHPLVAFELLEAKIDVAHSAGIVPAYRERREALCSEAARHLSGWFEWDVPPGGMFVWMRSRGNAIDTDELYRFAMEEKVAFVPSSVFDFTGKDRHAMRVNFTRSSPEAIREGVRRLGRAIEAYVSARPQLAKRG